MAYRVTEFTAPFGKPSVAVAEPKHYMNRAQAIFALRRLAYARLESFGKLDTQAAHDVMAAIDACDDILQPQESRNVTISNTGYILTISNTARAPR